MSLIGIMLVLVIFGFLSWLILQIPMAQPMKNIIIGVMVFFVILWVLQEVGAIHGLNLRLK